MSKIQIEGNTEFSKEKLTSQLINLIKGRLAVLKKEIIDTKNQLQTFQSKYSMSNEEFLNKFNSGELGDEEDYFVWKASIELSEALIEEESMLREVL